MDEKFDSTFLSCDAEALLLAREEGEAVKTRPCRASKQRRVILVVAGVFLVALLLIASARCK
jgi:hypothetical protein